MKSSLISLSEMMASVDSHPLATWRALPWQRLSRDAVHTLCPNTCPTRIRGLSTTWWRRRVAIIVFFLLVGALSVWLATDIKLQFIIADVFPDNSFVSEVR